MNQQAAQRKLNHAVRKGLLTRASACNRCGVVPKPTKDGRAGIHGHHADYGKPLEVEWICAACHRKETPLPTVMGAPNFGVKNGFSKLDDAQVISARRLRADGKTYQAIADRFGVDKKTIILAVKGKTWAHVPFAASPAQPAAPAVEPLTDNDCTPNHLCKGRMVHLPHGEQCDRCGHE